MFYFEYDFSWIKVIKNLCLHGRFSIALKSDYCCPCKSTDCLFPETAMGADPGTYCVPPALTFTMYCQSRGPHIIVGASVRDHNHDLALVGFGFAEQFICSKCDGGSRAGTSAPVVYTLDSIQQISFVVVLSESELKLCLFVRVLYDSYTCIRV